MCSNPSLKGGETVSVVQLKSPNIFVFSRPISDEAEGYLYEKGAGKGHD